MSEEIGLQRHVAFTDPRLERSTAVKCTEADHYISTTARSDICVLPVCLSLFKSPSWVALDIRVVNQDPVPSTKPASLFPGLNGFKCFCLIYSGRSTLFSPDLIVSLSIPPPLTLYEWLTEGFCGSRMCLDQFCSTGAVSFLLKCMGRSTKKRSKVRLHFNKEPSLSSLMRCCHALQLQRSCALVTENWSKRHWALPELTTPHHNITVTHTHCAAVWCVMWVQSLQFRRLELFPSWGCFEEH